MQWNTTTAKARASSCGIPLVICPARWAATDIAGEVCSSGETEKRAQERPDEVGPLTWI